jgi:predicted dehydrogenase
MNKINVGVIGVGYLVQHHARMFSELGAFNNVRLVGVVDTDTKRAKEISNKYGCDWYSNYRDMLDKVDAVSIVSPTTMHYEIAMDCIKAGKDILIEKPITTTVKEADMLIDRAAKAGTIIQVGHLERFNPVFSEAYRLINNPIFIEAERMSPFLGRGIDVDVTLDLMIHDIDIILTLINKPSDFSPHPSAFIKDIKATGGRVLTDNIDIAMAWFEFEDGTQALLKSSRITSEKSRNLKIFQKDSYILIDYQNMKVKRFFKKEAEMREEPIHVDKKEPLKEELKSFIECVTSKSRPLVSAVEGRNALKIALQIGDKIKR